MEDQANPLADDETSDVHIYEPAANDDGMRVLVVGSGPAGVRFSHELLKRQPSARVTLFGDEPYLPYNRVQLSALLAGEIQYDDILSPLPNTQHHPNFIQSCVRIENIDTENQCVTDNRGATYPYDALVLATGSRPHVPHIPGVNQTGVYTFRNLKDTESLYNRVTRARHIVVVGGGLLGLEAARALLRANTRVTVVQQGQRLMNRQLDEIAGECLMSKVISLGISVITNSGVRNILGDGRVTGVVTRDGDTIECDTVLLCAGIKPAVELARDSKIKVARGILVDDHLATSAKNVYAIGECSEHRGKTYGLVNPGFEQAAIAADVISKGNSHYVGSLEISRLKVIGETVCSMGEVTDLGARPQLREWRYQNKKDGIYRKIVVHKGKLIGAVGFGEWPEIRRIQEAYQNQRTIYPWQCARFIFSGAIWGNSDNDDVNLWPASTVVCQCNSITQGELSQAFQAGADTLAKLTTQTRAGTVCGSCKPLLEKMVGHTGPREKIKTWLTTTVLTALALIGALLIALLPPIPYSNSVTDPTFLEFLWNDKFWKQVTGFSLLGLSALGLLMSLRKRINNDRFGDFAYWRVLHIFLGASCVLLLVTHTGLRLGENLNQWLMLDFLSILILGGIAGVVLALGHKFSANLSQRLKRFWTWTHIIVVWPLPVLIAMHILTVYYF